MTSFLFPGLEPAPLEPDAPLPAARGIEDSPPDDGRQIPLFSDAAVMDRDLAHALAQGDFEEARRVRALALETFGPHGPSAGFDFLDRLGPELWELSEANVLEAWQELDRELVPRPRLGAQVRDGVFGRLLARVSAAQLAASRPDLLGPLCAALGSTGGPAGLHAARSLVRDVLLEGREVAGGAFTHDPPLADLLAEDRSPAWLVSLGALRRLWPVPAADAPDFDALRPGAWEHPASDLAAAREFWTCLRVARTPDRPEALLHEARRRMKRLDPALHALHMGRGAGA